MRINEKRACNNMLVYQEIKPVQCKYLFGVVCILVLVSSIVDYGMKLVGINTSRSKVKNNRTSIDRQRLRWADIG